MWALTYIFFLAEALVHDLIIYKKIYFVNYAQILEGWDREQTPVVPSSWWQLNMPRPLRPAVFQHLVCQQGTVCVASPKHRFTSVATEQSRPTGVLSSSLFTFYALSAVPIAYVWARASLLSPGPGGCSQPLSRQHGLASTSCLLGSEHGRRLSQQAAAASREFNELAAVLPTTYLPPAAPPPHLPCWSLPLPAPILAAQRQPREGERNYLLCACWKWKAFTF